ncbi:MAG: hypothetical protein GWN31_07800, partial [Candidatus Thorarchaeota archaeon]|nr:hypothetical protein [Candidatus Thorarchaeota archaeon]
MLILFIGKGQSGKTSTLRNFTGKKFMADIDSTIGINMTRMMCNNDWIEAEGGDELFDQLQDAAANLNIENTGSEEQLKRKNSEKQENKKLSVGVKKITEPSTFPDLSKKQETLVKYGETMFEQKETGYSRPLFSLVVWDFAGQKAFHAMHQIFFSKAALYSLVFNLREVLDEESRNDAIEDLKFWLNSKSLYAPNANLFLIGTHLDHVERDDLKQINKIVQLLISKRKDLVYNGTFCFFPVDNTKPGSTDELKENISKVVLKDKEFLRPVPLRYTWFYENVKDKETISFTMALEEAKKLFMTPKELVEVLRFLNDRGLIKYFEQTEELKKMIVIDPEWLAKALSLFIFDADLHAEKEDMSRIELEKHLKDGIFERTVFEEVLLSV